MEPSRHVPELGRPLHEITHPATELGGFGDLLLEVPCLVQRLSQKRQPPLPSVDLEGGAQTWSAKSPTGGFVPGCTLVATELALERLCASAVLHQPTARPGAPKNSY